MLRRRHEESGLAARPLPEPPARASDVANVLALQRGAGNRAVTGMLAERRLQRLFLDAAQAEQAFGEGFMAAHLDERVPEMNARVARLPSEPRTWMEALRPETKHGLLHQIGQDPGLIERICAALETRPPARYPNPADSEASWRFLLEIVKPDPVRPEDDLGMLGRLPEWVAKLKAIYEEADVRALERDLNGFHRAVAVGRRHLADVRSFVGGLEKSAVRHEPKAVIGYLTRELTAWLAALYRGAAAKLGLAEYVLLAVGSVGREEMFPRSDVDYTVLVRALDTRVAAVDKLIALELSQMGEPDLDAIGKGTPEEVADEHVVTKRDVLMDARTLHAEGSGGPGLEQRYYTRRATANADAPRRGETATALIDTESIKFSPKSEYLRDEDKDVKKGLLRLPTFTVRNLAFYYGREIEQLDVWARIEDLVRERILSRALAVRMLKVVDFASALRLKLHVFYGAENETFRLPEDRDAPTDDGKPYRGYVLTAAEQSQYDECVAINQDLFVRSQAFTQARSMTLPKLRAGATESAPTLAPGTGPDRDTTVRSTTLQLADGRTAVLEEILLDPTSPPAYRRVRLNGELYVVQPDQVLKTFGGKRIYDPSDANPFAAA